MQPGELSWQSQLLQPHPHSDQIRVETQVFVRRCLLTVPYVPPWLLQGDMSDAVASALVLPLLRCAAAQPWPTVATVATLLATVLKHGTKQLAPTAAALWCGASAARTSKVRPRRAIAVYCLVCFLPSCID
jgi:hypothetical protein